LRSKKPPKTPKLTYFQNLFAVVTKRVPFHEEAKTELLLDLKQKYEN
jgi:hypothetical protein